MLFEDIVYKTCKPYYKTVQTKRKAIVIWHM